MLELYLVVTVCTADPPTSCVESRQHVTGTNEVQCMKHAQDYIAQWMEEHADKKWNVKRMGCERPGHSKA